MRITVLLIIVSSIATCSIPASSPVSTPRVICTHREHCKKQYPLLQNRYTQYSLGAFGIASAAYITYRGARYYSVTTAVPQRNQASSIQSNETGIHTSTGIVTATHPHPTGALTLHSDLRYKPPTMAQANTICTSIRTGNMGYIFMNYTICKNITNVSSYPQSYISKIWRIPIIWKLIFEFIGTRQSSSKTRKQWLLLESDMKLNRSHYATFGSDSIIPTQITLSSTENTENNVKAIDLVTNEHTVMPYKSLPYQAVKLEKGDIAVVEQYFSKEVIIYAYKSADIRYKLSSNKPIGTITALPGNRLASMLNEKPSPTISIWNIPEKICVQTILVPENEWIRAVVPLENNRIASITDSNISIWDLTSGKRTLEIIMAEKACLSYIMPMSRNRIAAAYNDKIHVWETESGELLTTIQTSDKEKLKIRKVKILLELPNDTLFIVESLASDPYTFDLNSRKRVQIFLENESDSILECTTITGSEIITTHVNTIKKWIRQPATLDITMIEKR